MNSIDYELQEAADVRRRRKALVKNIAFKKRLNVHRMLEKREQAKLRVASIAAGAAWLTVAVQLLR